MIISVWPGGVILPAGKWVFLLGPVHISVVKCSLYDSVLTSVISPPE